MIPVLNEQTSLPRLLESIRRQSVAPDEIIVVDGGSTDGTQPLIRAAAEKDPRLRLIIEPGATPGRGRNVGMLAASNDWIALTDAGMELDPHWLENLIAGVRDANTAVVFGNFEPRANSYFAECLVVTYMPPVRDGDALPRGLVVPSSLIRRDVWEAAGRFPDLRAAEDRIFIERVEGLQVPISFAPAALVTWDLPGSLLGVFRRFKTYSMHNVLAGQQRHWHFAIARMYIAALVLAVLGWLVHPGFWLLIVALGLARSLRGIFLRSGKRSLAWRLRPDRVIMVFFLLLWIDTALFTGWLIALKRKAGNDPKRAAIEIAVRGKEKA